MSNALSHAPFRVDFMMCAPVQMDYLPTHLDGLLSWALLQERLALFTEGAVDHAPDPTDLECDIYTNLPLAKENDTFCASVILPQEVLGSSTRFYTRSSDANALASISIDDAHTGKGVILNQSRMRQIQTARGQLKTCLNTEQVMHSPVFTAYGVGEIDRVRELLCNHVFGLGKNRAKGFGSLRSIDVSPDEDAKEYWKLRAMRDKEDGYIPMVTPLRPPYWNKAAARIAYMPKDVL